jgi:predicted alpha-1,6-mannanase (GH76 family)
MRPEPEEYRAFRVWADEAIGALQRWYDPRTGLWKTAGWWNSANALIAVIQHGQRTGERRYRHVIETTFGRAQRLNPGFSNEYYDDDGWWAQAWIAAFDLTGEVKYLNLARRLFAGMAAGWDDVCGGGLWWTRGKTTRTRYRTSCSCSSRASCISARPVPATAPAAISTGRCANGNGSGPAA